ncbi:HlyD family secretion protein [Pseudomaricurvus alkylphenolicus]|uniref:efflux RND transporter periplasmic adaptor subunit n=1 Tax=Pseudomaricurvus alkylphenolicus TaxID=1306991 RepID=UPI00142185AE|nr:HlyD family secretion protein [Pseudomaricurvus alkylphenolicus]
MAKTAYKLLHFLFPFLFRDTEHGRSLHRDNLKWTLLLVATFSISLWVYHRSHTVVINDARIASNVIVISSNRSGWIERFAVGSGSQVKAGDLLVQIDDRAAKLAIQEVDIQVLTKAAEIERARSERNMVSEEQASRLISQQARLASARSNANKAESSLQLAQSNFSRTNQLLQKQLVSKRQWEEDQLKLTQALENHEQAKSELQQQTSELRKVKAQMISVELLERKIAIMQQDLERLKVKRQQLGLDVNDRQLRSPIDAVVDKTFGHASEFISPGRRLVMLHNPRDIWINANIRETELRHVRPGMKASISVDAYPDLEFQASVTSIDHATTSEFALLPNPNPSGNFTKVTQRLRIKLSIDQQQDLLKPGMMVEVIIDTRS